MSELASKGEGSFAGYYNATPRSNVVREQQHPKPGEQAEKARRNEVIAGQASEAIHAVTAVSG